MEGSGHDVRALSCGDEGLVDLGPWRTKETQTLTGKQVSICPESPKPGHHKCKSPVASQAQASESGEWLPVHRQGRGGW